jgi:hypothetical protein
MSTKSEIETKDKSPENTNEIKIELQLGDVIEIKNPINEQLNEKKVESLEDLNVNSIYEHTKEETTIDSNNILLKKAL